MGLQVCVTLQRKGFRIKHRVLRRKQIPKTHKIGREEAIEYMKENYNIEIGEEE